MTQERCRTSLWVALFVAMALGACGREPEVEVPADAVVKLSDAFSSDFALTDTNGAAASDETFRGKVMVVYFGFATCPDVCPLALARLSAAMNELSERDAAALAPVFITVDPERDTPERLKAFLAFDPRIVGLTGSAAAIDKAKMSFKVAARRAPLPGSSLGYTMNHTSLFYLVDREGRVRLALHDTLTPVEMAEMLRRNIRA